MAPQSVFIREVDSQNGPHERYYPSSLRHLSIWAYLALAFIILAATAIFAYAIYSCYHSAPEIKPQLRPVPHITSEEQEATTNHKRKWKSESQRGIIQPNDTSQASTVDDISIDFESPSLSAPSLAHAVDYPLHMAAFPGSIQNPIRSVPATPLLFDSHNIRFVAPKSSLMSSSTAMIWKDPKLSPVQGMVAASTRGRSAPALAHPQRCRHPPDTSSKKAKENIKPAILIKMKVIPQQ